TWTPIDGQPTTGVVSDRGYLFLPRRVDKAEIEEFRHSWHRLFEIPPAHQGIGHHFVARRAQLAICAERMQLVYKIIIGVGRVLAILLGVFDQNVDSLLPILWIIQPANSEAVGLNVAEERISILFGPIGICRPHGKRKIL